MLIGATRYLLVLALAALSLPPLINAQNSSKPSEIDLIFADDQQARKAPSSNAPKPIYQNDDQRREATRKLLVAGRLQSGKDFEEAAVVFQHSRQADDYLLAHTLSLIAISMGDKDAIWIASASLDRYLMAIGQPQIYGTQYMTPAGKPATQEPYNRSLISDALRTRLQIPSQADQEVQRKAYDPK